MTHIRFTRTAEISAPLPIVWRVMTDVERWPQWTASMSRVRLLSPGPLQTGSRVRIRQPGLPSASWRVTEMDFCAGFIWVSRAPGLRVTARHSVEAIAIGTQLKLSVHYGGLLGALLARWVGDLNEHYLALEADGLKAAAIKLATQRDLKSSDTH